jgi:hypothetical protein
VNRHTSLSNAVSPHPGDNSVESRCELSFNVRNVYVTPRFARRPSTPLHSSLRRLHSSSTSLIATMTCVDTTVRTVCTAATNPKRKQLFVSSCNNQPAQLIGEDDFAGGTSRAHDAQRWRTVHRWRAGPSA